MKNNGDKILAKIEIVLSILFMILTIGFLLMKNYNDALDHAMYSILFFELYDKRKIIIKQENTIKSLRNGGEL